MDGTLALFTPLKTPVYSDGTICLTEKFIGGIIEYLKYWDGSIKLFIEKSRDESENLDNLSVHPKDLPFDVEVVDYQSDQLYTHLKNATVALTYLDKPQLYIQTLCDRANTPNVYTTEYSLKTRRDIVRSRIHHPVRRLWREAKEIYLERLLIPAAKKAMGVQCNGFPTYHAYKNVNANPFFYFDSRIHASDLIQSDAHAKKQQQMQQRKPLNLIFSGRLDSMKGADDLPKIALELLKRQCDFQLHICGDGPLESTIKAQIASLGIGEHVHMHGILNFKAQLLPLNKEQMDLFICTHKQGDPACTYIETLACGVPIVGYQNEAFSSMLDHAPVGWGTSVGHIEEIATTIIRLDRQRQEIANYSQHALDLAKQHTFEKTFESRISHIRNCVKKHKEKGR